LFSVIPCKIEHFFVGIFEKQWMEDFEHSVLEDFESWAAIWIYEENLTSAMLSGIWL
jgi:hypothetical protein